MQQVERWENILADVESGQSKEWSLIDSLQKDAAALLAVAASAGFDSPFVLQVATL